MNMKKFTLIITISITCFVAVLGQSRLGSNATEIKNEFYASSFNLQSGYLEDNTYYISISAERATVFYYFDSDKICNLCIIIPDDQGALNYYVEKYNRQYVIISATKWKMYSEGGISNIELIFPEDGGFLLVWSIDKNY